MSGLTRSRTTKPLMICGKIHDRDTVRKALAEADIALSGKSMLLNPDFVDHVRQGRDMPLFTRGGQRGVHRRAAALDRTPETADNLNRTETTRPQRKPMSSTPASTADILAATQSGRQIVLDVLPPEHFEARHIPGARNACVYEVTFPRPGGRPGPGQERPGHRLRRWRGLAGRRDGGRQAAPGRIRQRIGPARRPFGLEGRREPLEGTKADEWEPAHPVLEMRKARYTAVRAESTLIWTGRNAGGRHTGTLAMREGTLIREGEALKGLFTLAMDSITNTDLAGTDLQSVLENHLKSDDFFFVSHFPTCTVEITDMVPFPEAPATLPNFPASPRS